jgi:Fe-S cluster assembly iron-binding protein IscA
MITVTERAATELQDLLATSNALPGQGIKLVPSGAGSIGMTITAPSEGDEVIRRGEEPLLIVDSRITGALAGSEIDCEPSGVDGQPRAVFKLRPPT